MVNGALNESATPCASPLTRTYNVTDVFTLSDVDIGVRGEHTYRGDLVMTLEHPDGTRVQIVNGSGAISGDNFNFRLNDGGTQVVNTDGNTTNHSSAAVGGGFENNFIPNSALAAFNGKPSNGVWTLEICDQFNGDSGNFFHSELYLTNNPTNFADLSLTNTASTTSPAYNTDVTFTLNVTNSSASNQTATATILNRLPSGLVFQSFSGNGTYNETTGIWTPSTIAPGQTRQVQIVARMLVGPGGSLTSTAQVQTSNRTDSDSSPGNGSEVEDDQESLTITTSGSRTAGIPPTLVCPDGSVSFGWDGRSWTPGSTNNTYTITTGASTIDITWDLVTPAGWLSIAAFGGAHPRLTTGAQSITTLSKAIDFDNRDQISTTTVSMGNVVDGAQFRIIDVDFASEDFADKVTVTGTLDGVTVIPVLTAGTANYVVGNSAFGDTLSGAAETAGDVYATFDQPIDTILVEYGNHSIAPLDPDGQAIQMDGAITFCNSLPEVAITKSSVVLDDMLDLGPGVDEFTLPNAQLSYCILLSNTGDADASNLVAIDGLDPRTTYVTGSMQSGDDCASASVAEDDDTTDDNTETDGITASFNSGTITILLDTLEGSSSKALTFTATIN